MKYRYRGPLSGVTLASGQEVMLHPGGEVELPEDSDYTKTLLALGYLAPLPGPHPKTTKAKPAVSATVSEAVTKGESHVG